MIFSNVNDHLETLISINRSTFLFHYLFMIISLRAWIKRKFLQEIFHLMISSIVWNKRSNNRNLIVEWTLSLLCYFLSHHKNKALENRISPFLYHNAYMQQWCCFILLFNLMRILLKRTCVVLFSHFNDNHCWILSLKTFICNPKSQLIRNSKYTFQLKI